jgi:coenzyme Q-binding protein COQ10
MPSYQYKRLVAVPPEVAYTVASDVGAYARFLPLVKRSTLLGMPTVTGHITKFEARLEVTYLKLNLNEVFDSNVTCDADRKMVVAVSNQPPFKHLQTVWMIKEVNGFSEVSINIDYALKNILMQMAASAAMSTAVSKVMSAFESRALLVHKQSSTKQMA